MANKCKKHGLSPYKNLPSNWLCEGMPGDGFVFHAAWTLDAPHAFLTSGSCQRVTWRMLLSSSKPQLPHL